MFLFFVLYHFDAYVLEIFKAQKCGMRLLWVNFWSRDSYGFDFCPHLIIPRVSPPPPTTPWALKQPTGMYPYGDVKIQILYGSSEGVRQP